MKKKGRRRRARIGSRDCLKERESGEINRSRGARGESYANSEQWLLIERRKKLASVPLENGIRTLVIFHLLVDSANDKP